VKTAAVGGTGKWMILPILLQPILKHNPYYVSNDPIDWINNLETQLQRLQ
jgi:hypothetical protein